MQYRVGCRCFSLAPSEGERVGVRGRRFPEFASFSDFPHPVSRFPAFLKSPQSAPEQPVGQA